MSIDPYIELVIPEPPEEFGAVPGSAPPVWEPGTAASGNGSPVPGTDREPGTALYADLAALLDGTLPEPPEPEVLSCTDGVALFYRAQVNHVFGDPESGKTFLCQAAVAEALTEHRRAAIIDMDHNGPASTVSRLFDLGAPEGALRDLDRFRYAEPEDGAHLVAVVRDLVAWKPSVVVLDSLGEILPVFGGSSNSPDDFTRVHSLVMKPLAMAGASVLVIDHLAKSSESRAQGATGTAAKKRAVGGVSLRVTIAEQFVPGKGGAAHVAIAKDRHGGLRAHRPTGDKEPLAGTFRLYPSEEDRRWAVHAPASDERNPAEAADAADVEALRQLAPPPRSVEDARTRLGWRKARAAVALRTYREQIGHTEAVPGSGTQGREPGTATGATCPACGDPVDPVLVAAGIPHCEVAS
ncbi:hypothetical protein ABRQ22_06565 [Cellulosimicrobium sp. ES-005]|uniref:AAA+ ATPase domain-containing protein n=1 Tax=Cellulosimicrobium sp. ES-005 TaxID=3163031 RepID=A0AAU8G3U0_9MICO